MIPLSKAAVAAEAEENAPLWFPELDAGRVRATVVGASVRPRCFLHRLQLDDGQAQQQAIVKVRHSQPHLRRLDRFEHRPQLNPERTMSDSDAARREYDALQLIDRVLDGAAAERFGVLRPLALLPEQSAIIMDFVEEGTLRKALMQTSRFRLRRRAEQLDERAWVNA